MVTFQKLQSGAKEAVSKRKAKTPASAAMATKKQKISAIPRDVFTSADECARAIDSALATMDPPLEVFGGVVRLIAEFAQPWRK